MHSPALVREIHDFGAAGERRNGETVRERLAEHCEVGRHAKFALCPADVEAEAGDDLVEDEDSAGVDAGISDAFEIAWKRRDGTGIAHCRFHYGTGDVALIEPCCEPLEIVPLHEFGVQAGGVVLASAARYTQWRFVGSGLAARRCHAPQDIVEPAVVMSFELDDRFPVGSRPAPGGLPPAPRQTRTSRTAPAWRRERACRPGQPPQTRSPSGRQRGFPSRAGDVPRR